MWIEHQSNLRHDVKISYSDRFERECEISVQVAKEKVGPNILFHTICKKGLNTILGPVDIGILVMERFDTTLEEYLRNCKVHMVLKIFRAFRLLGKQTKLTHRDLHEGNIVIKWNPFQVRIIDFGFSQQLGNLDLEIEHSIASIKIQIISFLFQESMNYQEDYNLYKKQILQIQKA